MPATVLIVEDDVATRAALTVLLAGEGRVADAVGDGSAALAYLSAHPAPRVILLDLMMPVMDGWQFLVERQKHRAVNAVPVIVVTAAPSVDAPALRALGAEEVLAKPVDPGALLAAVRRYC
jgi:CheY-like chemotaxis protein